MRIVHYFFEVSEASGGVSRAIYDLVQLLGQQGHDVTLLSGTKSQFPEGWDKGNVRLLRHRPGRAGFLDGRSRTLVESELRAAEVLHLHGLWRPSTSEVAALARRMGIPYVMTTHGTLDDWSMARHPIRKRIYYRLLERRNLESASAIHTTATAEQTQAAAWIPHDRIRVIPYSIDLSPYEALPDPSIALERFGLIQDRPSVLFLSRLHPKKGPEILIRAVARARENGVDCQLWLAGTGERRYTRRLQRLTDELLPDARWLGLVTGEDKLALYQCADFLALPTHQENFALVLPESLACGTPALTTRGTDIWEELQKSGGVRIAEPTVSSFTSSIVEMASDRNRLREMGSAGRQFVFDWLEPRALASQYEEMYREAMSRGVPR